MDKIKTFYQRYKKETTIGVVILLLLFLLLIVFGGSPSNPGSSTSLTSSQTTTSQPSTSTVVSSTPVESVTVTFDLQGGSSGDGLTRTGTPGQPLNPPNATFVGYTLLGYDADPDSETGSMSLVFPNEDTTYYAIWDANAYRVTFNQLSGSIKKYDNTLFASLYIDAVGDVYALGQNRAGIYGNGTTSSVNNSTPYFVSQHLTLNEGETVVDLAIQSSNVSDYAFLLTSDDRVFSAGNASFGLVGNNETSGIVSTYVDITPSFNLSDGERIIQISPGQFVAGALSSTGRVFVWGNRTHLGFIDSNVAVVSATPVDVTSTFDALLNPNETIRKLEIGAFAGYAFTNQGRIFAWGTSTNASFAFNKTLTTATPIDLTPDFLALMNPNETLFDLAFRDRYGLLQTSEGRVFDWGDYRQVLGIDQRLDYENFSGSHIPFAISSLMMFNVDESVLGITDEGFYTNDNRVFALAPNTANTGQIYDYGTTNAFQPGEEIVTMSIYFNHQFVVTNFERVLVSGINSTGILGIPQSGYNFDATLRFSTEIELAALDLDFGSTITYVPEVELGQVFPGWFTDKSLTQPFTGTVPANNNLILYTRLLPDLAG